jgi:hypothetical protein
MYLNAYHAPQVFSVHLVLQFQEQLLQVNAQQVIIVQ